VNILDLPLARAAIDRAGENRLAPAKLSELWETGRILHLASGKFLTNGESNSLAFLTKDEITKLQSTGEFASGEKLFLGISEEVGYFAWCADAIDSEALALKLGYKTLREIGDGLIDLEMGLAIHAQALSNWHHTHPHCARCGDTTTSAQGGSLRVCDKDGSEHYPRTDPAVIVLVKDKDDRVLLGRQSVWPEHRFSCFAGFVEPGESFEQCVIREVGEEAGVLVSDISYLGSQPWPFPASIMIAFQATTLHPELAKPDTTEIEEIRWLSRIEMRDAVADGSLLLPPGMSVARKMIESWYGQNAAKELSGGERWRS
jgi:NAD+ diphosphatase